MDKKQIIVLDSNEIILGLEAAKPSSQGLIDNLDELSNLHDFKISNHIFQEIIRNLSQDTKEKFKKLLSLGIIKIEESKINKSLINKYKNLGLKKGDILVAAYTELVKAGFLVSENRHFLEELKTRTFKIINAKQFIKEITKFKY